MVPVGVGRTFAVAVAAALTLAGTAQAAPQLVPFGDFTSPIYVASPPGDTTRVFVVERAGRIQVISSGQKKLFLDISGTVDTSGERGLLSMALAPDYATSGLFYVFDAEKSTGNVKIEEFQRSAADPDVADPASRRVVMNEPHGATNHNAGQLQFGPDGYLYATVGDNATSSNAQTLTNVYGKILRIDPRAGHALIPADNPFVGTAGARGEIWALGLRNPWRFSFDRATGDLIIGDVGAGTYEEINFAPASAGSGRGLNFGWPNCEGPCNPANSAYTDPVYWYDHNSTDCAITGGYVIRADDLPSLAGRYLFGDYCTSVLRSIVLAPGSASGERSEGLSTAASMSLVSFGEDTCGHIYVIDDDGPVSRLSESSPAPACPAVVPAPTPTPGPTPTPAPEPAATPPPDKTPPRVSVRARHRQRILRSRTLRVSVVCSEPCSLIVSAHVSGPRGRSRPKARVQLGSSAAARRTITLRFTRRGTARIRRALRAHRTVRAVIRAAGIDAAGNWGIGRQQTVRITG
jgi:glucose/arabinose dehydrogenase